MGVLAGVDLVYRTELNDFITLQASYVNVWEVPEHWAGTVNDAGTMLDQLRVEWTSSNAVLANANWDMIHLMSKRGDTGTGGIAYLSVVCSPDFACGFSSAMDNQSNFPVIPPNFTWNLFVVPTNLATTSVPTTPTGVDGLGDLTTPMNLRGRTEPFTTAMIRKVAARKPSSTSRAPS